jgi:hypothetical protein
MEILSFMSIEEDEKDLIVSFALDEGNGDIKSLILHRSLLFESIMPEEEIGTKVSLEGDYLEKEHLNTLECFQIEFPILKIKSRLRSYEIDAYRLGPGDLDDLKESLARQNYDGRFEIITTY